MYLDDEVPLDIAIIYLKLDKQEKMSALTTLISYANHLGLSIYFDNIVQGYKMSDPVEETFTENGHVDKLLISEDTVTLKSPKTLKFTKNSPVLFETNYYFSVFSYKCDETDYYMVDETGLWLESSLIEMHDLYIRREDLEEFDHSMASPSIAIPTTIPYEDSSAVLTALAILSKSYADKTPSYKHGKSINASAIKKEILRIAENYGISNKGLKKIDDKISLKIKELELNEDSKMDNSK